MGRQLCQNNLGTVNYVRLKNRGYFLPPHPAQAFGPVQQRPGRSTKHVTKLDNDSVLVQPTVVVCPGSILLPPTHSLLKHPE